MRDKKKLRAAQWAWMKKRRQEWFAINGPCAKCGSNNNLELDHIDPNTKISHNIWSWADERRTIELAKCQVLCKECHKEKSDKELERPITHGTRGGYSRGCRCIPCKEHQSLRMKNYNSKC